MIDIKVENLYKSYGNQKVLENLNLFMKSSQVYGIIGRNGSGKSVLLKCIAGLTSIDSGRIMINEKQVGKDIVSNGDIGFIIDKPGFIEDKSGYDNLRLLASICGKANTDDIVSAMKLVGLDYKSRKKVKFYSLGMRQKLGIAQAIMENPDIIILDEPMNALDEITVDTVRTIIKKLKTEGKLIIITSHNHEDIDFLCDDVFRMKNGRVEKIDFN